MNRALFLGRILTLVVIVAAIVSKAAQAAPYTPSMAGHSAPAVSQPFSPSGQAHLHNFGVAPRMK
jgi:hypothetical protein